MTDALSMPMDVRLMNLTAAALFAVFGVVATAALALWGANHGLFALSGITVSGDVAHSNAVTLRANVVPKLGGSFLTLDLQRTREVFESVPWVRRAVVRREFPNRLRVILQEHRAAAYWGGEADSRLLNTFGEVFEANAGEVEHEALPRLAGPAGQAPQVLAMYQALQPLFEPMDLSLDQLELTGRGSWVARLDTGAAIEIGRGDTAEVVARTARFLKTLTQVTAQYQRRPDAIESADLRHVQGYALRLRGVSTGVGNEARK